VVFLNDWLTIRIAADGAFEVRGDDRVRIGGQVGLGNAPGSLLHSASNRTAADPLPRLTPLNVPVEELRARLVPLSQASCSALPRQAGRDARLFYGDAAHTSGVV
jgi:hypothetical protein